MNIETKNRIKDHLIRVMEKLIKKRVIDEPFDPEQIEKRNPFGFRLVPLEVWQGSKFERSFVTTLGQGIFEQIAKYVAEGTGAIAENQYVREIEINTWRTDQIERILKEQRGKKTRRKEKIKVPTIKQELEIIRNLDIDKYEKITLNFDLYIKRASGEEEFYSFKTVKPNLDQTEKAKKDILLLMSSDDNIKGYFGLPYNPAGDKKDYRKIHSIPYKLFNMEEDECVLIGSDLWNCIGQDENTYTELLQIFKEVGSIYIDRIRKEYFNIYIP